jgi:hypothetical protein
LTGLEQPSPEETADDELLRRQIPRENPIPPERRTKSMTLKRAARLMGIDASKPAEQLKRQIDAKTTAAHKLTRQSYIFDTADFPASVQAKIRPTE